jgi:hypothetical protein
MKCSFKTVSIVTFSIALLGSTQAFARTDAMVGVHFGQGQQDEAESDTQAQAAPKDENRSTASVSSNGSGSASSESQGVDTESADAERMASRTQFPNGRFR